MEQNKLKGKSILEILKKADPEKRVIAEHLRTLVKETLHQAEETVKWGNITYLLEGKNLAWILFYRNHVNFGFFKGAQLSSQLLEGTGKSLRHIKLYSSKDFQEKKQEITSLLKEASTII